VIASQMRRLDEALAHAAQAEVDAKRWRIKSGQWREKYEKTLLELEELKLAHQHAAQTAAELARMIDTLRAERDTWRAQAQVTR
jgi:hypothetical protein